MQYASNKYSMENYLFALAKTPRKYKNNNGTSSNGLYFGSINSRNLFTNDDCVDLWEIRNEEVHDKEEAAKQQKRKAKAAISVWTLHELQDQARPSNAFLFYQDVEE